MSLEQKISETERELEKLDALRRETARQHSAAEIKLQNLQLQQQINKDELKVTDHAVIRYLERHLSIDVGIWRKEILDGIGDPTNVAWHPRIADGKVVTIIKKS